MSEKKPAAKFRVWGVFSFVFAGFDALVLIIVVIAWIVMGSVLFSELGNFGLKMMQYSTGVDVGTVFNLIMLAWVLICVLHISIDIHTGILLRRPVRRKKAPYIIYAIRDIIMAILNLLAAIVLFLNNETVTTVSGILCYLLPTAACVISVIMLFMRVSQDEPAMTDGSQQLYNIIPPVPPAKVVPPLAAAKMEPDQPKPFIVPEPTPVPAPASVPVQQAMGSVRCTEGAAKGQGFRLPEGRKVVVGKSPQRATLVINNPHISNVHCSIRYHADKNTYIVKDHSTNGTFVNGVGLQREVPVECPVGTVLSLADGKNKITLG